MIVFLDVIRKLSEAGYNTTRIRKEHLLSEQTLTNIRNNKPISTRSLDVICNLTHLPVEEIIKHQ